VFVATKRILVSALANDNIEYMLYTTPGYPFQTAIDPTALWLQIVKRKGGIIAVLITVTSLSY